MTKKSNLFKKIISLLVSVLLLEIIVLSNPSFPTSDVTDDLTLTWISEDDSGAGYGTTANPTGFPIPPDTDFF